MDARSRREDAGKEPAGQLGPFSVAWWNAHDWDDLEPIFARAGMDRREAAKATKSRLVERLLGQGGKLAIPKELALPAAKKPRMKHG